MGEAQKPKERPHNHNNSVPSEWRLEDFEILGFAWYRCSACALGVGFNFIIGLPKDRDKITIPVPICNCRSYGATGGYHLHDDVDLDR